MTPEQVLAQPPRVLSQKQRESYFAKGYLLVEDAIPKEWIERLRSVTAEMVERSRERTKSDAVFDLEPGHTAKKPRLRRLSSPVEHHQVYWDFVVKSPMADIAADLVGPHVKFHHSKLNFKWPEGGKEVKWHQDIQFWPHTNYSPLTVGVYLYDCGSDQGPLGVVPGSHEGPLFDQYNDRGEWVGCLAECDLTKVELEKAEYLMGPAGSITIHNCRTIHGSEPNLSDMGRPLLLNTLSSADAFPYTHNPLTTRYYGQVIRGERARWAHHDSRPCLVPPIGREVTHRSSRCSRKRFRTPVNSVKRSAGGASGPPRCKECLTICSVGTVKVQDDETDVPLPGVTLFLRIAYKFSANGTKALAPVYLLNL